MRHRKSPIPCFVTLLALAGCGGSTRVPYPTDASLVDGFAAGRETFELLAADPDNPELLARLGIRGARVLSPAPDASLWFEVWFHDLVGPGGCSKGYAYQTRAPASVVDSIGAEWGSCPPEQVTLFRRLEGSWYLYYSASN